MQQTGGVGVFKEGSGVWLFSGPPSLWASNSWNQTSICINTLGCTWMHAHTNFTLTWNSVVLRMWRPSGLQREETSPIEPSSILQCQSGCSRDHTWRERQTEEGEWQKDNHHWWYPSHTSSISLNLISNSKHHLSNRNHERLALDTPSEVRYLLCSAHEADITLVCSTCLHHFNTLTKQK